MERAQEAEKLMGETASVVKPQREELSGVTIRIAGDSGDGIQVTGSQFTSNTAYAGYDLATLPDFPAEIRAPAGTMAGVSAFQIQFGSTEILTPGDEPDVLVAMNPAALKANLKGLRRGAAIILNQDAMEERAMAKVGFKTDPRGDGTLDSYRVIEVPITSLTMKALEGSPLSNREKERCKNFFALGLMFWMFGRSPERTSKWIEAKFKSEPTLAEANQAALKAGLHFGDTTDLFHTTYTVPPARLAPGLYRQITGNQATAYGFIAGAQRAGLTLFLGSYPITPASDVLHELASLKHFGVRTFQAEDEIAAVASAIGASFGGELGLTTTSGPGLALKSEAINLALMVELPLVIANIQRGGPSTGLPTKTEQADLLQALFARNGESPVAVVAAATPSDCFAMAIEAVRLATKYMTPVIFLSDGYIANGAEPWRVPEVDTLPDLRVRFEADPAGFTPYRRDPVTLARPWVRPGTPGLEHRIGGLEKEDGSGNVSYDPANHEHMVRRRADKIARIADDIVDAELDGPDSGELLLVGWGGTFGAIRRATIVLRERGIAASHLHLRHLAPMAKNVGPTLSRFKTVICCELNLGQLQMLLRAKHLVDVKGIHKVQGQPFRVSELVERALAVHAGAAGEA